MNQQGTSLQLLRVDLFDNIAVDVAVASVYIRSAKDIDWIAYERADDEQLHWNISVLISRRKAEFPKNVTPNA